MAVPLPMYFIYLKYAVYHCYARQRKNNILPDRLDDSLGTIHMNDYANTNICFVSNRY